jgi:hypothetical protein
MHVLDDESVEFAQESLGALGLDPGVGGVGVDVGPVDLAAVGADFAKP